MVDASARITLNATSGDPTLVLAENGTAKASIVADVSADTLSIEALANSLVLHQDHTLSSQKMRAPGTVSGDPDSTLVTKGFMASEIASSTSGTNEGGPSDHGTLGGLGDDDHPQYHTEARATTWGDGRYYTKAAADTRIDEKIGLELDNLEPAFPKATAFNKFFGDGGPGR